MWHVTHNTYTQLSSEMGLPGLGDLCCDAVLRLQDAECHHPNQNQGSDLDNLRALALSLRAAFITFLPIAFFDALGLQR